MTGTATRVAWQLSYELDGITARGEFLRAAAESVGILLPADSLGWIAVRTRSGEAEVYGRGNATRPEVVAALARVASSHPMLRSYRDCPWDMTPRRMSDLIAPPAWRSHPVYAEAIPLLGDEHQHQATINVTPFRNGSWSGWSFLRARRDFTDDEMATAVLLQPVLMALNHASARAFGGAPLAPVPPQQAEAAGRIALTPRETRVLELLATGLTADAIGHICRISPRTVRKHLENIYAKLGCHDRLMAVRRAADLGLIWP
jgi:DNA-binding CsgD family transcriptional regulator